MIPECYKIFNKIYYSFFKLNKHRNINHIKLYISANKQLAIGKRYYLYFCSISFSFDELKDWKSCKVFELDDCVITKNIFTINNIKLVFNKFLNYVEYKE